MVCVVRIGVCGRLSVCGVFESEGAVDVMVCAMHCVCEVFESERAVDVMVCAVHCRNWRLWQVWCARGVSIRTSCGCDGMCCALQELAFVAGLVRVGCFNQNELLDVLHMLFPGKTEEDIQEILQRIMDGTQKDADKDM